MLINWELLRSPLNWVTILAMVLVLGTGLHYALTLIDLKAKGATSTK